MSDVEARSAGIESLLGRMTLEEKLDLLAGVDMWHTAGVPRLGVPGLKLSDGPHGVRGERFADGPTSASFPCGSCLGATWDPELAEAVGRAIGEEAESKGAHVVLGPTVNLHHHPLAGRNFECFAEDPWLTARLAVAWVRGVQSRGVGACIKHFVCNDSEFERHTISSEVDERVLREVYGLPFEVVVREARPWALMSAYNKLNGTWCSEHRGLLLDLLKGEWGFDGFVVSDWFGTNGVAIANGGLDLEMPGPARHMGEALREAVKRGEVSGATVDDKVRRLLRVTRRAIPEGRPEPTPERADDRPEHRALARRVAREGLVLLRNEACLPLDPERLRRLAVIGPNAHPGVFQGGGSSGVSPHYSVSPLEAIRERCGEGTEVVLEPGCTRHKRLPLLDAALLEPDPQDSERPLRVEFFEGLEPAGRPVVTRRARRADFSWFGAPAPGVDATRFAARMSGRLRPRESGRHTLGVASAGLARVLVDDRLVVDNWSRWERGDTFYGAGSGELTGEVALEAGRTYRLTVEYSKENAPVLGGLRVGWLPPLPEDALERAVAAARDADAAVVVVGLDADWESEGHDRADLELPGRQAELVARVADANPRTVVVLNAGAPLRMEDWVETVPAVLQAWYGGQEAGHALADVLFGDADPGGRLPCAFPRRLEDVPAHASYPGAGGRVVYADGLELGQRGYDRSGVAPRFPLGFGLSYARFGYGALRLDPAEVGPGETAVASVEVTNRSPRTGQEVVQLYVHDREHSLPRPEQELRDFAKLTLAPGETRTLRFALSPRHLAFWHPGRRAWIAEPGRFEIRVGCSSQDIRARADLVLRED